jgi:hypothetical protein
VERRRKFQWWISAPPNATEREGGIKATVSTARRKHEEGAGLRQELRVMKGRHSINEQQLASTQNTGAGAKQQTSGGSQKAPLRGVVEIGFVNLKSLRSAGDRATYWKSSSI